MPCLAASPERGWTKPACPSGIATARPVADERALARRELDALAGGEVEARVAGVRARRQTASARSRRIGSSDQAAPRRPARRLGDEERREARQVAARQAGDRSGRPRRVSSRSSIGVPSA